MVKKRLFLAYLFCLMCSINTYKANSANNVNIESDELTTQVSADTLKKLEVNNIHNETIITTTYRPLAGDFGLKLSVMGQINKLSFAPDEAHYEKLSNINTQTHNNKNGTKLVVSIFGNIVINMTDKIGILAGGEMKYYFTISDTQTTVSTGVETIFNDKDVLPFILGVDGHFGARYKFNNTWTVDIYAILGGLFSRNVIEETKFLSLLSVGGGISISRGHWGVNFELSGATQVVGGRRLFDGWIVIPSGGVFFRF